jgi:hypothetical protein
MKVNRLSKWAVLQVSGFIITAGQTPTPVQTETEPLSYCCHLELDISSDANYATDLPKQALPALFQELVALGTEIVGEGDKP